MEWEGFLSVGGAPPAPRRGQSMSRFPLRNNIVVLFGGQAADGTFFNDMHVLNLDNPGWSRIHYGNGSPVPPPRAFHTLNVISARTLVLFGGDSGDASNRVALNDLWTFNFTAKVWSCVHPSLPPGAPSAPAGLPCARFHHTTVFHVGLNGSLTLPPAMYVFGGHCSDPADADRVHCLHVKDWTWEELRPAPPRDSTQRRLQRPVPRELHAALWVPGADGGMLVVGGDCGGGGFLADVWLFQPPAAAADHWSWREIKVATARSTRDGRLAGCAGHSAVLFGVGRRARSGGGGGGGRCWRSCDRH
jgi:Galactose oxidase, central domain